MPLDNIENRVVWWVPSKRKLPIRLISKRKRENVGDSLAPVIVQRMLEQKGLAIDDHSEKKFRVLSVGSILHFAEDGDTIWGTGVNGKISPDAHIFQNLDVRAVRGPITRDFLEKRGIACPEVYGDPGILLPTLFPEITVKHPLREKVLIVPHLHDLSPFKNYEVLHPTTHWSIFVEKIQNANFVISGSLHGIILAEAFGIPARWLKSTKEDDLKYQDYFLGTGRERQVAASSIQDAEKIGPHDPPEFGTDQFMDQFPYDLWTD